MKSKYLRGEIYYADLGEVTGSEQGGTRPVLIVQNNAGNTYSPTTIIVPITSQKKPKLPTHVDIKLNEPSTIMCEQIKTIDKTRLLEKIRNATCEEMILVNDALRISLNIGG